jgi:hypothetical protein
VAADVVPVDMSQPKPSDSTPPVFMPRIARIGVAGRLPSGSPQYAVANRVERTAYLRRLPPALSRAPNVVLWRVERRLQLVELSPGLTGFDCARLNRDLIIDLCAQLSIPYFVVPEPDARRFRVSVEDEHWPAIIDALVAEGTDTPLYFGVAGLTRRGDVRRWSELSVRPRIARAAREQSEVEVFRSRAPGVGWRPYARPWACVLDRWHRDAVGVLHAPGRNQRAPWVARAFQEPATIAQAGRPVTTLSAFTHRSVFDMDFPIDLVYLWVDGSDPQWIERQRLALKALGRKFDTESTTAARFRESGELRYSLRSVQRYAPWVRRIYLVSDRQVPSWLNRDHPRIQIVDHTELFGGLGTLPTFNSHAIGARLHHIEGLSEQYLYFNDDVFLGRELLPQTFFQSNGVSKFFLSNSTLGLSDPSVAPGHENARRNVADLLARDFGTTPTRVFFHTPIPQRRSLMFELEDRYRPQFELTWRSQFRANTDFEMNSWLHNYYGYLVGKTVPGAIRYDYFDLSDPDAWRRMTRLRTARDRDAFCVNDNSAATQEQLVAAMRWLEGYFPGASEYETD